MAYELPFPTVWAENSENLRDPTVSELDQGFECGATGLRELHNFLFQDMQQAINALSLGNGRADIPINGWQSAPPGAPSEGDRYVVKPTGTGAWAGHDGEIASFVGASWVFASPLGGLIANYVDGTGLSAIYFNGTTWSEWRAAKTGSGPTYLTPDVQDRDDDQNIVTPADLGAYVDGKVSGLYVLGNGQLLDNSGFSAARRNLALTTEGAQAAAPANGFSLAANTYMWDRWRSGSSGATVNHTSTAVQITAGSLRQTLPFKVLAGQEFCYSAIVQSGTLSVTFCGITKTIVGDGSRKSLVFTVPTGGVTNPIMELSGASAIFEKSVKLEVGRYDTGYQARPGEQGLLIRYCNRFDFDRKHSVVLNYTYDVLLSYSQMAGSPTVSATTPYNTGNVSNLTTKSAYASSTTLTYAATATAIADFTARVVIDADYY